MIITKDTITLESQGERQILWDAMWKHAKYCFEIANSDSGLSKAFTELYLTIEKNIQIPMYEIWDDIKH